MKGVFITGTDTGVGKTVVAAALMHRYRHLGRLRYWKPIQTGIEQDDDTATVRYLGSCREGELHTAGIRLREPLAPYLAAQRNGTPIGLAQVTKLAAGEDASHRWAVEGAGGALVPINDSQMMTDLMTALAMPVLIATRSTLGTINHTLLTLEALRGRDLSVAGVVMIGEKNGKNREAIEHYGAAPVLGEMPHFSSLTPETLNLWAASSFDREGRLETYLQ